MLKVIGNFDKNYSKSILCITNTELKFVVVVFEAHPTHLNFDYDLQLYIFITQLYIIFYHLVMIILSV